MSLKQLPTFGGFTPTEGFQKDEGPKAIFSEKGEAQYVPHGAAAPLMEAQLRGERSAHLRKQAKDIESDANMALAKTGLRVGAKVIDAVTGTQVASTVYNVASAAESAASKKRMSNKMGRISTALGLSDLYNRPKAGAKALKSLGRADEAAAEQSIVDAQESAKSVTKYTDPVNDALDYMDYANMAKSAMHTATSATAGAPDQFTGMRKVSTPAKGAVESVGLQDTPGFRQVAKAGMDPQSVGQAQLAADKADWFQKMQSPATQHYGGVEGGAMLQQQVVPQDVLGGPQMGAVTTTPGYEGYIQANEVGVPPPHSDISMISEGISKPLIGALKGKQKGDGWGNITVPGTDGVSNYVPSRDPFSAAGQGGVPDWGSVDLLKRLILSSQSPLRRAMNPFFANIYRDAPV